MLLRFGSVGDPVRNLQNALNKLPPTRHALLAEDGIFGKNTHTRVTEFQGTNKLAPDGIVGPLTLNVVNVLLNTLTTPPDPLDRNFRLPKRRKLHIAIVYFASYRQTSQNAKDNIEAANNLLDTHNLELDVWPPGGERRTENTMRFGNFEQPIKDTREAYQKLRRDVDDFLQNKAPRHPLIAPVIFCEFDAFGKAVTPHSTKIGVMPPANLISMSAKSEPDNLVLLHELGHSALFPKATHNRTPKNLMFDASPRDFIFRFQVEAFALQLFASVAA